MIYQVLDVKVDYEKAGLVPQEYQPKLYVYARENSEQIHPGLRRPAVIICPGGGYERTSDREAEPVAIEYLQAGVQAFVLRYSCRPAVWPAPQLELAQAIHMVRSHAEEWCVDPDKIIISGFSAGGHLAASVGCFWDQEFLYGPLGLTAEDIRPNGQLLCYPVISSGEKAHRGSFDALLGEERCRDAEWLKKVSLEYQAGPQVPKTFIWHTVTDEMVPVENTLYYISALKKAGVNFEAHLFPVGEHGISLAQREGATLGNQNQIVPQAQSWMKLAKIWLDSLWDWE